MKPARILVVDDEPDVEDLVTQKFRRQVRRGELEFVFARDGQEALDRLTEEPDVVMVLSDINMPRMDGLTLLERLSELHQDLKTVIVSAYGDMGNIRTAMNRGAFDFVTKPIEFDDLETTIEKTLSHVRMFRRLQSEKADAEKARATLSHYFSPSVAEALSRDPNSLSPGGERRFATFVFTDLAGFTSLVEASDSAVIVALLNAYLDAMTRIIFEHEGTLMKMVGDSLYAIFGAPVDQSDHAARAVACALAMDCFAEAFRAEKNAGGIPLGITRIGVNSGQAIVGNFGGEAFFDYTAFGDAVNVAARLESANKRLGTRICVSERVADQMADFRGRPAGTLLLEGKTDLIKAFEPLTEEQSASPAVEAYKEAFALLEKGDPRARQAFAALVGQYGEDSLATFHLKRTLAGETGAEINLLQ